MKKLLLATAFLAAFACQANAQTTDTLGKIKASGTVLMGVREDGGGLSYALGGGKYGGFHVEICQHIVKSLEKTVRKKLQINYVPVNGTSRIPETIKGKVDLECGVTTNNATRQRDVAFVVTTFVEEVRVVVRADSGINSVLDLNGKTLATSAGTTSITLIRKQQRASNMDFKEAVSVNDAEAFASLEAGRADAYVMDSQIIAGFIANAKNPSAFKVLNDVLSVEPIAIMMRKDDPALKKVADTTVSELVKSGEIAKLYDKWFVQPAPPKKVKLGLAASANTKAAWANLNDKPAEDYAVK